MGAENITPDLISRLGKIVESVRRMPEEIKDNPTTQIEEGAHVKVIEPQTPLFDQDAVPKKP